MFLFYSYLHITLLESSSCCSSREPIVGNIVNKVRHIRKHQKTKQNRKSTDSSTSSTSLSSLAESNIPTNSNGFPMVLPQRTVTLELGVIDTEPIAANPSTSTKSEHDVHQLIEMCRRWRDLSRKSRDKFCSKLCDDQNK